MAFFEGTMRHRRFEPVGHAFGAELFFAFLDVDALPASLDRFPMWSARRTVAGCVSGVRTTSTAPISRWASRCGTWWSRGRAASRTARFVC